MGGRVRRADMFSSALEQLNSEIKHTFIYKLKRKEGVTVA